MRWVIAGLAALMLASPASAQEPAGDQAERRHEVKTGETLWALAGSYLNDPFKWPTIYQANTDQVEDPDLIFPGQMLVIPVAVGRTAAASRPAGPEPLGAPVADAEDVDPAVAAREADRTVFYRRPVRTSAEADEPTVLAEPVREVFPVRPGEFASAPYVAEAAAIPTVGRLLRSLRMDPDDDVPETAHPRDRVLLTFDPGAAPEPGARLLVVAVGDPVPGTMGAKRVLLPRGVVRIEELGQDVMEGRIESQYGPIMPGQLLVPIEPFPEFGDDEAEAVAGGHDVEARILAFVDDRPLYSRTDIALISAGSRAGVRVGDVFQAMLPRRPAEMMLAADRTLPMETVAELRVIRVTADVATVRVDDLELARLRPDLPVRRVRKMP